MSQANQSVEAELELIAENRVIRGVADAMNEPVDEAVWHFREEEIYMAAVDPANVFMVEITVPNRAFESYTSTGLDYGMNLDRLIDLLKISNATELLKFEFNTDTWRLDIQFGDGHYELRGIDPEGVRNEPELSDLTYLSRGTVDADELEKAIRVVDLASDHVYITGKPEDDYVRFAGKGDTDDAYFDVGLNGGSTDESFESIFSLDYVKMLPNVMAGDEVDVFFGDEWPARFEMNVVETDHVNIPANVMIAPRIVEQ